MQTLEHCNIEYLVVHCSDTDDLDITDIHNMHLGFGWDGVGYHKVIKRDGTILSGRPEFWQGAHVKGKNDVSLGVCLIGRDHFTDIQFDSLIIVLSDWKMRCPEARIVGHRDIQDTAKTCPSFDAGAWWKTLKAPDNLYAFVRSPLCPLWEETEDGIMTERATELVYGETVQIVSRHQQNQLMKIHTLLDSYEGWVHATDISVATSNPTQNTHNITWPTVTVTSMPDVTSPCLSQLYLGSQVECADTTKSEDGWQEIFLPSRDNKIQTGFIPVASIMPTSDWVGLAEQFEYTPYLWGGRSSAGIDCSALIQLCLQTAGLNIPRNSVTQCAFFQQAPHQLVEQGKQHKRGDLIFWPGHVALCLNDRQILHANAFHHKVAREDRMKALRRLQITTGSNALTLRPIF